MPCSGVGSQQCASSLPQAWRLCWICRVGAALLRGEWQGAVRMLLTHHEGGGNSRGSVGEASRAYVELGDVAKALASMPSFMVADCAILRVRGPLLELPRGDPAIRCLPGLSRALVFGHIGLPTCLPSPSTGAVGPCRLARPSCPTPTPTPGPLRRAHQLREGADGGATQSALHVHPRIPVLPMELRRLAPAGHARRAGCRGRRPRAVA